MAFRGKVFFITGASSGIGREMALQLSRQGALLLLGARNLKALEELKSEINSVGPSRCEVARCDVTRREELEACVAQGLKLFGRIDTVVANAGFGVYGKLEECDLEDFRRQFDTNVFGVLRTIYASLDALKKSRGQLAIIGSVGGYIGRPGLSAYSMSKFSLRGLAQSLREELRPCGVRVALISPGMVVSDVRKNAVLGARVDKGLKFPETQFLRVKTKVAVAEILDALRKGKEEAVITRHGRVLAGLMRLMPGLTTRALAGLHRSQERKLLGAEDARI
ncbi:MAG: SDR family NAD(P)-dependent oxidoreductase [Elusimicrobia bacterium]|nr:SDR family NAD(P)-dependent oxidoreductase [Elusimicrobiota bacterium]